MKTTPSAPALRDTDTWVFDLDNTLYCGSHRLFEQIDHRMTSYLSKYLDLDRTQARRVQKTFFRKYGSTLRGMMVNHNMDPKPYLDYVHHVDISSIPPSPDLDAALARLPGRKVIFTNADLAHAERVLNRLGVTDHFDTIFDIRDADFLPKPEPEVYDILVKRLNFDPIRAVMVEDIARNLEPAARLGMGTVWIKAITECEVCQEEPLGDHVDYVTDDLVAWLAAL